MAKPLRVYARSFVLTYSALGEEEQHARDVQGEAFDVVARLFPGSLVTCGAEQHKDGTWHVHVGCLRPNSKEVQVGMRADVLGHHPNVSPHRPHARDALAALDYPCKEDPTPIMSFDDWEEAEAAAIADAPDTPKLSGPDVAFRNALAAESYDGAMQCLRDGAPRDYVLRERELQEFFARYFSPPPVKRFGLEAFRATPVDWAGIPARASVIMAGGADIGKTSFALAHFENPLFVNDIDKLRRFNHRVHDGIVFDDFNCTMWPADAIKNLMDNDFPRDIRCRYNIVTIPAHTKKIFCTNNLSALRPKEWDALEEPDRDAIITRQHVINYTDKLY